MTNRYTDVGNERYPAPETTSGTLERDVGSDVYRELHRSFPDHLPFQVADLTTAAANGDVPAAQYVAHQVTGTAPSFGANRLEDEFGRVRSELRTAASSSC